MKELSIEEKAKEFDASLERAKKLIKTCDSTAVIGWCENIFPMLEEPMTEDERTRKELIAFLKENHETGRADETWSLTGIERWIAWLENQSHDGKKWIYEDVYLKEKEQLIQDGIDEVLENPQKYGLEKQGEQKELSKSDQDVCSCNFRHNG